MSEWAWVALGFLLMYAGIGAYLLSLRVRSDRVRHDLRGPS